ncbi:MAG: hypothetical protein ACKOAZ_09915 [Ilumatobacteraceae bacterium]
MPSTSMSWSDSPTGSGIGSATAALDGEVDGISVVLAAIVVDGATFSMLPAHAAHTAVRATSAGQPTMERGPAITAVAVRCENAA